MGSPGSNAVRTMQRWRAPLTPRYICLTLAVFGTFVFAVGLVVAPSISWLLGVILFGAFALLGAHDLAQTRHSVLRSYPISAHLRFIMETIRPEMRQYFFEDEKHGTPFSRDRRAVVYQRAKGVLDKRPFGTQYEAYQQGFEWLDHSIAAKPPADADFRVRIGGPDCAQPYMASVYNISAMSFGALSPNAIRALNQGAAAGGFAHDTGEGGISPYHLEGGGDIIWEIGSGYFGARTPEGQFSPDAFAANAARQQVKMVELKLSQGAKPGHGGVLPAAKVSPEIAAIRGIPMGQDCVSPSSHAAFSTPIGLLQFVAEMRRLSGGKPAGFKLCIGHRWEFLAICKAMLETGLYPDFIVVDGKEGGTGAAPLEFMDHIGTPMREGLNFVHNALVGIGVRDRIRLGASGKIITGFDMARAMALGADWCNAARGYMFAIGCIQSQSCHTDRCPTGVATQDPARQRALVVRDKAPRVRNFHANTLQALAELVGAAGLEHPNQLRLEHLFQRVSAHEVASFLQLYPPLHPGELLEGTRDSRYRDAWALARPDSFAPAHAFAA